MRILSSILILFNYSCWNFRGDDLPSCCSLGKKCIAETEDFSLRIENVFVPKRFRRNLVAQLVVECKKNKSIDTFAVTGETIHKSFNLQGKRGTEVFQLHGTVQETGTGGLTGGKSEGEWLYTLHGKNVRYDLGCFFCRICEDNQILERKKIITKIIKIAP